MYDNIDNTTGGFNTASPASKFNVNTDGINHEGRPAFDEEWHNDSSDTHPDSTTHCRSWEDLARRESYEDCTRPTIPEFRTYSFDPYETLRTVLITGEAWCSLHDAGAIAGIPVHEITGIYTEWGEHVRGAPHFLDPDGIRCLDAHGIDDNGVRVEALVRYFKEARGGSYLAEHLIEKVIHDVYAKKPKKADRDGLIRWKPQRQAKAYKWCQHRFYDVWEGEYRVLIIGTRAWVAAGDISQRLGLPVDIIVKIAGQSRALKIPNSDIAGVEEAEGVESYIRFDAVTGLFNAMGPGYQAAKGMNEWLSKNLFAPENQRRAGMFVRAKTLHSILSEPLSFSEWTTKIKAWTRYVFPDLNERDAFGWKEGDDFRIPLTDASDIARQSGSRRGILVHLLLRDGGYLRKGPVAEPVHATLKRFKGLLPDRHDRMKARAVHEFLRDVGPYESWIKWLEEESCLGQHNLISFDDAYEHGLGREFDDHYCGL